MEYDGIEYEEYTDPIDWVDRAMDSLGAAQNESEQIQISGDPSACLFQIEQAIEKASKAIIVYQTGEYLERSLQTHDIPRLLDAVYAVGYSDYIPPVISEKASKIFAWEAAPRYYEYNDWDFNEIYFILDDIDPWIRNLYNL